MKVSVFNIMQMRKFMLNVISHNTCEKFRGFSVQ